MNTQTDSWSAVDYNRSLLLASLFGPLCSAGRSRHKFVVLLLTVWNLQGRLKETLVIEGCNTATNLHTDPISLQSQAIIWGASLINYNKEQNQIEYDSVKSRSPDPLEKITQKYTVTTVLGMGRQVGLSRKF